MGNPIPTRDDILEAAIASGAALSGSVNMGGRVLVALVMPAAWTAADITLQASVDDATFSNVYAADGTELTISAAASRYVAIAPSSLAAARFIKLRSGTSAAAVNQGAARSIQIVTRAID